MAEIKSPRTPEERALKSIAIALAGCDILFEQMQDDAEQLPPDQRAFLAQQVGSMAQHLLMIQNVIPLPDVPDY